MTAENIDVVEDASSSPTADVNPTSAVMNVDRIYEMVDDDDDDDDVDDEMKTTISSTRMEFRANDDGDDEDDACHDESIAAIEIDHDVIPTTPPPPVDNAAEDAMAVENDDDHDVVSDISASSHSDVDDEFLNTIGVGRNRNFFSNIVSNNKNDNNNSNNNNSNNNNNNINDNNNNNNNNNAVSELDSIRIQRANVDRIIGNDGGGGSSVEGSGCGGGNTDNIMISSRHRHLPQYHRGLYTSYSSRGGDGSHSSSSLVDIGGGPSFDHVCDNPSSHRGDDRVGHHYHHCQHHSRQQFAHIYDQNYYRSVGDWLHFVRRRGGYPSPSVHDNMSSDREFDGGWDHRRHHHQHPGYDRAAAAADPDTYYRGFDNTRIHLFNVMGQDAGISLERRDLGFDNVQYHHSPPGHRSNVCPNFISHPIDEEAAGEERGYVNSIMPPTEIHCTSDDYVNDNEGADDHPMYVDSGDAPSSVPGEMKYPIQGDVIHGANGRDVVPSGMPLVSDHPDRRCDARQESIPKHGVLPGTNGPPQEILASPSISTLRVGGIIRPHSSSNVNSQAPVPAHMQDQHMHAGAWDSKYVTYSCRIDQSQEDRSVEIIVFSLARPHMRAFHMAWIAFFLAFMAWFSIIPLLAEVQNSLDLTKEEIWTSSIFGVAGSVVTRCVAGLLCDKYGGRWMIAVVLFTCGIPTMCTGLVNTSTGLSVSRLFTGMAGSAFVPCQYWTSTMFTREVAGTANSLAAGWGNLGGGVAQIFVGSVLFPLFKWIYGSAGTTLDPAEASWRTCCVVPGLMCIAFTFVVIRHSDDHPKGNYSKRKKSGFMRTASSMTILKSALRDHNTWLLLVQYGCCFGVELTTSNAAALYFKEEFELSTEAAAAIASLFGWMNLFARGLGGFFSDISNAYLGMRGRLIWQFLCFALEGIFIMVFSKARTLPGAIVALITFSLFVQFAEGSTFGIVPYLNSNVTGMVSGIVGAGGNAGAVIFSIAFRQMKYRDAFFFMGTTTSISALLSCFVWIKGYEGLVIKQRFKPSSKEMEASTIGRANNE